MKAHELFENYYLLLLQSMCLSSALLGFMSLSIAGQHDALQEKLVLQYFLYLLEKKCLPCASLLVWCVITWINPRMPHLFIEEGRCQEFLR